MALPIVIFRFKSNKQSQEIRRGKKKWIRLRVIKEEKKQGWKMEISGEAFSSAKFVFVEQ
jgi:outer membrane receptor for ferric coprogen and ferric-rhodotorulic acid